MPPSRPKATPARLALDEQSFQSLLAAAFTIQQHNDQLLRSRLESPLDHAAEFSLDNLVEFPPRLNAKTASPEDAGLQTPSTFLCEKCGAAKLLPDAPCAQCSEPVSLGPTTFESPLSEPTLSDPTPSEPLRPGERLQRNWASMWMKSQEHNHWLNSASDDPADANSNSTPEPESENLPDRRPRVALSKPIKSNGKRNARRNFDPAKPQSASNALANPWRAEDSKSNSSPREKVVQPAEDSADAISEFHLENAAEDALAVHAADSAVEWNSESLDALNLSESTPEDLAREESNFVLQAAALENEADAPAPAPAPKSTSPSTSPSLRQQLADFRVKVSFHRADLYLTLAVVVAFIAILWPVAAYPRPASLSAWDRTLITLGLAEVAPPPAVAHFQGDPSIQVWIDPHTGIYYCPGDDQYGKTNGGRYSTQRDAQQDSFEAASRSACE
jgi:hypothetical protein